MTNTKNTPSRIATVAAALFLSAALAGPALAQDGGNRTRMLMLDNANPGTIAEQLSTTAARKLTVEGSTVSLMLPVEFDYDSAALRPQVQQQLAGVARVLNDPQMRGYRFLIEGHTDWVGSDAYNQPLSERRAFSVVNYLAALGIDRTRMTPIGYGRTMPLPNLNPYDGRNRRVEFVLLPDSRNPF